MRYVIQDFDYIDPPLVVEAPTDREAIEAVTCIYGVRKWQIIELDSLSERERASILKQARYENI